MDTLASAGARCLLAHGHYTAEIATIGGALHALRFRGRDLVLPHNPADTGRDYRGALLAPWANRIIGGRYAFGGRSHQLPLNEVRRGNALHGLAAELDFTVVAQSSDAVTLEAVIDAPEGYPWRVRLVTSAILGEEGLRQTVRAENLSPAAAPFGAGAHPYLVAGAGSADDWSLQLPATRILEVTPDRMVPIGLRDIDDARDFRELRPIGATRIDSAYTGILRDEDGRATARLLDGRGDGVSMSWGPQCPWVQVYTADHLDHGDRRAGIAVEPMTCPPDAFNAARYGFEGAPLVIEPGGSVELDWVIGAIEAR